VVYGRALGAVSSDAAATAGGAKGRQTQANGSAKKDLFSMFQDQDSDSDHAASSKHRNSGSAAANDMDEDKQNGAFDQSDSDGDDDADFFRVRRPDRSSADVDALDSAFDELQGPSQGQGQEQLHVGAGQAAGDHNQVCALCS